MRDMERDAEAKGNDMTVEACSNERDVTGEAGFTKCGRSERHGKSRNRNGKRQRHDKLVKFGANMPSAIRSDRRHNIEMKGEGINNKIMCEKGGDYRLRRIKKWERMSRQITSQ